MFLPHGNFGAYLEKHHSFRQWMKLRNLAERGGFEPPVHVLARTTV